MYAPKAATANATAKNATVILRMTPLLDFRKGKSTADHCRTAGSPTMGETEDSNSAKKTTAPAITSIALLIAPPCI